MIEIRIDRKIPISIATVLILLVAFSSAAGVGSGPITTTTVQTINGLVFKITGAFTVAVVTFIPIPVDNSGSIQPCTWGAVTGGVCRTPMVTSDWELAVNLQLNTVPVASTTYTITAQGSILTSPLSFSVPPTATANSIQQFNFDIGTSTLPGAISVVIVVS